MVRDLREAMSLGSTQSGALQSAINSFGSATTAHARQTVLDSVINAWADTSAMGDGMARNPIPASAVNWYNSSVGQAIATFAAANPALYQQLSVLERYTRATNSYYYDPSIGGNRGYTYYTVSIERQRLAFCQKAYDAVKTRAYQSLYLQTEGKALLDQVELIIDDKGLRLGFDALNATLASSAQGLCQCCGFDRLIRMRSSTRDAAPNRCGHEFQVPFTKTTQAKRVDMEGNA